VNESLNLKLEGFLIFKFKKLREISFSELMLDHNKICKDFTLDFYLDRLGSFLFTKDLSIHRANRVKKISYHYMKYEVNYSNSRLEEILDELNPDDYNYILIARTNDLIIAYHQILLKFHRIAKDGTYLRTNDISRILKNYITYFNVKVIGSLKAA
jgi:hypothetical protein